MTTTKMQAVDAKALIREQLAKFADDPDTFPSALALRARMACKYSIRNQVLMMSQAQDVDVIADRIMPKSEWLKLGYAPNAMALYIWSKPIIGHVDADGNRTFSKVESDDEGRTFRAFKLVPTYPARFVIDADGNTAQTQPADLEGSAAEVFNTLSAWMQSLGWTIESHNVDQAGGWTSHVRHLIRIDPRFEDWDRVRVLLHESAHALLHGPDDSRPYEGDHRGDMEAEADGVAFAVLAAYGQHEAAARVVRYVAGWAGGDVARIESSLDRASSALDAIMGTLHGEVVEIRKANTSKGDNRALASWLRENHLPVRGPVWTAAKSGERDVTRLTWLAVEVAA